MLRARKCIYLAAGCGAVRVIRTPRICGLGGDSMGAPAQWDCYIGSNARSCVRGLASAIYYGTRKVYPMVWIGRGWDTPQLSGRYPETGQWSDEHGTGGGR